MLRRTVVFGRRDNERARSIFRRRRAEGKWGLYVLTGGLGDDQAASKRMTLAMRPKPSLSLHQFGFDRSSLTTRLQGMVNDLAKAITQSWKEDCYVHPDG